MSEATVPEEHDRLLRECEEEKAQRRRLLENAFRRSTSSLHKVDSDVTVTRTYTGERLRTQELWIRLI